MGPHARPSVPSGWQAAAVCRDVDPELFFAPDGEHAAERARREDAAKRVCLRCGVRAECLAWALTVREGVGVWGGTTEDERRALARAAPPVGARAARRAG